MDISNQTKDVDMQPKAPTFGLGAHGHSGNIVGRPGSQYITDQNQRLAYDGAKSYRHGVPINSGQAQMHDMMANNDAVGRQLVNQQSSHNSNSFKSSGGGASHATNHRKNSKSSYQIIQNNLSKTKSVKTVGSTTKIHHNIPQGSNNRQSVPFLHNVQAHQTHGVNNSKSTQKLLAKNADQLGKQIDSPDNYMSQDNFMQTKKQIHRAAFNYSLQDQNENKGETNNQSNQVLAQSMIGQSNTNLGVPQTGAKQNRFMSKFTLDLKNMKKTQINAHSSSQEENLTARKKTSHKKKTKKNSVAFDTDMRGLPDVNNNGSLRFKKLQNTMHQMNTQVHGHQTHSGSVDKQSSQLNQIQNLIRQNNNLSGLKSARSFTQHKDLDMDKDKKNMTGNFNTNQDKVNTTAEKRKSEYETFKYAKDSNQLLISQSKAQQQKIQSEQFANTSVRLNDNNLSFLRNEKTQGSRAASNHQRSVGRQVLSTQFVNPLNQNLEFLHTAKRAIRKLESSQDNQKMIDPYMLNTTRDRQGSELMQQVTPSRQSAANIDDPDTFETDENTNNPMEPGNQIRLKHMLQMRNSHNLSQQSKVNFIKQNIQEIKDIRTKRMSKMSNKQSPRNSSNDRSSQLRVIKPQRNKQFHNTNEIIHSRSNSATDNIQIRGLNQTSSMANIINQVKTINETKASLKELKENPNEPFKNEIKSLIIMNPSFNQTQTTLTNQQLRDGVPQNESLKEAPQSTKSNNQSYLNNFRTKKVGDTQKKESSNAYNMLQQADSQTTKPHDHYQTESIISQQRSRDGHKQLSSTNDFGEQEIYSEDPKHHAKIKSTFPKLRKSLHSGAASMSSSKASPLNSKRRSKNERQQNLKGLNQSNGYKNPYLLQLENVKGTDEELINQPKGGNTTKKRNNQVKYSKTNPINTEKKMKSETPRGGIISPQFEQPAIIDQYKTEAPNSNENRSQSNRLTRQQRRQNSNQKSKIKSHTKDSSQSASYNQSNSRRPLEETSFQIKDESAQNNDANMVNNQALVEQSFQEGNTGGQLNEGEEDELDENDIGMSMNTNQLFSDQQPIASPIHQMNIKRRVAESMNPNPSKKINGLHDVQLKMKTIIHKFRQKQMNDKYMINYLQQENKKLKQENERMAAALAARSNQR